MIRRPIPKDVKITVEDVLEFLQNRSHIGGEEDYEPFHLILYGYGPAAGAGVSKVRREFA